MTDAASHRSDRTVAARSPPRLEVLTAGDADAPAAYTFVPRDAAGEELLSTWVTVAGEDVLDLAAWR